MDDCIRRDDAINGFVQMLKQPGDIYPTDITTMLQSIPSADVRPVVRGRWINEERVGFGSVEAECSNCGRRMIFNHAWICCPWCMADMRGSDNDG